MARLQGDLKNAPALPNVYLDFEIPVYTYSLRTTGDGDNLNSWAEREEGEPITKSGIQVCNSNHYKVDWAEDFLIGNDISLFRKYVSQSVQAGNLENLTITVVVHYF